MKKNFASLLFISLLFVGNLCVFSQKVQLDKNSLEDAKTRPDLSADISKISKLKIYLSKETFHFQELMFLDVGLLVNADNSYFFPADLPFRIIITDEKSERILIDTIYSVDAMPVYEKTEKTIIKNSLILLVGCENKFMDEISQSTKYFAADDLELGFEKNLFRTIPNGCIEVKKSSKLEIYIELISNYVVVSPNKDKSKTAVGTMRSNTLSIFVKE